MGQKDLTEKSLLMNADVFADVVNAIIGDGDVPVVTPESLHPYSTEATIVGKDKISNVLRDICMQSSESGTAFAIFGVENQSDVDRFMPVRCMQYDASVLMEQVKNLQKPDNADVHLQVDDECLQKQSLRPVVTLCLYYGAKPWTAGKNVRELTSLPEYKAAVGITEYMANYRMNFVDLARLTEDAAKRFQSDFSYIVDSLRGIEFEKIADKAEKVGMKHPKDTCSVLYELNGKNEDYLKIPLNTRKGSVAMRDWAKEIREEELVLDNLEEGKTQEQIEAKLIRRFGIDAEEAREIFQKYAYASVK